MKTQNTLRSYKNFLNIDRLSRIAILLIVILVCACAGKGQTNKASPWPTSTPEMQGMDSKLLLNMLNLLMIFITTCIVS